MLLDIHICNAYEDHAELRAQKDVEREDDFAECPEALCKLSSLVGESGGQKVKDEVDNEGIFKERIDHCSKLS